MPQAMVVDDEKAMWPIFQRPLEALGYEVLKAGDGKEAIKLLEKHTPALLFLDVRLPFVNGQEVFEYVQSQRRLDNMHIVVFSSSQTYAPEFPRGEFLLKPIRIQRIQEIGARVLRATRQSK